MNYLYQILSQNQPLLLTSTPFPKLQEVERTICIRHKHTCTRLTMMMMWGSRRWADIIIRDRQPTILLLPCCFTSTQTMRLIRDRQPTILLLPRCFTSTQTIRLIRDRNNQLMMKDLMSWDVRLTLGTNTNTVTVNQSKQVNMVL